MSGPGLGLQAPRACSSGDRPPVRYVAALLQAFHRYDGTYKRLPTCSAPSTLFRHFSLSIFPPHHDHTGKIRRCKETFHRFLNIAVAAARCLALLGTRETPPNAPPSLPALCGTPKAPHRRQPNHCCPAVVTPFPPSAALPWFVAHPRPGDDRTPVDVPLLVLTKAPTPGSLSSALDPLSSLPPSPSPLGGLPLTAISQVRR